MQERHTVVFKHCDFNVITDHDRRTITLQFVETEPLFEIARKPGARPIDPILRALDRRFGDGLAGWLGRWRTGDESPLVLAARPEVHPENPDVVRFLMHVKEGHPTDAALATLLGCLRALPGYQQTFGDPLDRDIIERGTGRGPSDASAVAHNTLWAMFERSGAPKAPAPDEPEPRSPSPMQVLYAIETYPELDAEAFIDVLRRSTLAERRPVDDPDRIASMLRHADLIVTARVDGLLVGVSRAITDFSYCTYLSDLAVDEAYQHRGIGRELIRRTHEAAGTESTLILLAAPKARGYYPRIGMKSHDSCWIIPGGPLPEKAPTAPETHGQSEARER